MQLPHLQVQNAKILLLKASPVIYLSRRYINGLDEYLVAPSGSIPFG